MVPKGKIDRAGWRRWVLLKPAEWDRRERKEIFMRLKRIDERGFWTLMSGRGGD